MATIEDMQLVNAAREAAVGGMSPEQVGLIAAALGGTAGYAAGTIPHEMYLADQGRKDDRKYGHRSRKENYLTDGQKFMRTVDRTAPGYRFAGGLVGAILGGAIGSGARSEMINNSPTAALLAKAQIQGDLDAQDKIILQDLITQQYANMGIL